jgi:hypothetical protein
VLQGITGFRAPTEVFDKEKTLLGGVRVRLVWLGPGHTRSDWSRRTGRSPTPPSSANTAGT